MFPGLGMMEMAVIAGLATLIFGPRQLPKLARGIGESIKEFRRAGKELTSATEGRLEDE
jgi:sec-independent protein translocase protein TatA